MCVCVFTTTNTKTNKKKSDYNHVIEYSLFLSLSFSIFRWREKKHHACFAGNGANKYLKRRKYFVAIKIGFQIQCNETIKYKHLWLAFNSSFFYDIISTGFKSNVCAHKPFKRRKDVRGNELIWNEDANNDIRKDGSQSVWHNTIQMLHRDRIRFSIVRGTCVHISIQLISMLIRFCAHFFANKATCYLHKRNEEKKGARNTFCGKPLLMSVVNRFLVDLSAR